MKKSIKQDILDVLKETSGIPEEKKTELANSIIKVFGQYKEPVSEVLWVPINTLLPNSYNPNKMAAPEKRLLLRSLIDHGITMPLLVCAEKEQRYTLIDGYHRWRLIKKNKELLKRLGRKVPVVVLDLPNSDCIVATIRHNRARGRHQIGEISEVVKILSTNGWPPAKIMDALGMDADEVLRLKQFKGLGEMFKDGDYSSSWN
ncbi:ParB/RepB/Spo0J family partition protein [Muricauda sp. SCSIO 64092]|uniref:IbrB-like domain-containing protein n=1 Tax=Allomuricauda sp. SCSIO 64092 TaxID=2908842 RepID=UPI001FF41FF1|nr:ParB/RepB/Spo0J family partition protein [Muricauda sp. SCSIO 64092]UOY07253.1 ParB/RepB/Spo0J family partition protein [Muricauda sp. SCSIO 64092]